MLVKNTEIVKLLDIKNIIYKIVLINLNTGLLLVWSKKLT